MDMAGFYAARLAEVEATAKAALAGPWHIDRDPLQGLRIMDGRGLVVTWTPGFYERGDSDATHIALNDPARVLREVEAGRAILAMYADGLAYDDYAVGRVIRVLVAVYSDHPDYDEEWAKDRRGI